MKRKPFMTMPKCVFELALGEQSQLILNGQYVTPQALFKHGFKFQYPNLEQALTEILLDH